MPRLALISTLPVALLLLLHTAPAAAAHDNAYPYPSQAGPSTAITPYDTHPLPPTPTCSTKTVYETVSSFPSPPPATYDTSEYLYPTRLPPSSSQAPPATYDTSKYLFPTRLPPSTSPCSSSSPTPATYDTSEYLFPTRLPPGYLSTHTTHSTASGGASSSNGTFHTPTQSQTAGLSTTAQSASPTQSAGEPVFTGGAGDLSSAPSWSVGVGAGVLAGLVAWL